MGREVVELLAITVVGAPLAALAWIALVTILGVRPAERTISHVASGAVGAMLLSVLGVAAIMWRDGETSRVVPIGSWLAVGAGDYQVYLSLRFDYISLTFAILTALLTSIVARFSSRYLHREPGYLRFHVLFLVFSVGMMTLVLASSLDFLIAGWELVGLASVLLIAFFSHREVPVRNALRTYAAYRVCDLGLIVATAYLHRVEHTTDLAVAFDNHELGPGLLRGDPQHLLSRAIPFLLLFAASGKSAQLPFGGWLPRAMEGPTPSSAVFYGGLSIHAGAYLLLRAQPLIEASPAARAAVIGLGLATAAYATLVGRAQCDAKTQIAFAAMTQVGLVFVEIGLGLTTLALLHVVSHACLRTLQFLRAPSMLRDFHGIASTADGDLPPSAVHYELALPERLGRWAFTFALLRGGLDGAVALLAQPLIRLGRFLDRTDRAYEALVGGRPSPIDGRLLPIHRPSSLPPSAARSSATVRGANSHGPASSKRVE